jgi:hypothetical protein
MVAFHVLVVLHEDQLPSDQPPMRKEVVFLVEAFYRHYLLLSEVIVLELFNLVFLVLHPQDPPSVEVKGYRYFRHLELPVQLYFILIRVNLVKVLVLKLQLHS